jgi:hypothetical protein
MEDLGDLFFLIKSDHPLPHTLEALLDYGDAMPPSLFLILGNKRKAAKARSGT